MTNDRMLVRLGDTGLTTADADDDIRGMAVVDRNGDEIGDVDDLVIDPAERRVRMLEIGSGGFLGLGEKKKLMPVDAVTAVDDRVHVAPVREHVSGGPTYDPDLIEEPDYQGIYDHYGYEPFWTPGYIYPGFPFFGYVSSFQRPDRQAAEHTDRFR